MRRCAGCRLPVSTDRTPVGVHQNPSMARSLYANLFRRYGTPKSRAARLEISTSARRRLREAYLLPANVDGGRLSAADRSTRVAVVGGGFAGLMAAWYLRSCDIDVTLFEATGRLGGRVETDRTFVPHKTVEAGAELIGENHPMWMELAAQFGLHLPELGTEEPRVRLGGHELDDVEKKQLRLDMEPVFDAIGRDALPIDPIRPWLAANAHALDAMSVADKLDQVLGRASSLVRTALEFVIGNDNCAPVGRQSYLGLLSLVSAGRMGSDVEGMRGYWQYTETNRCAGGNDQLAARLAAGLPSVHLNAPVVGISVGDGGVTVDAGAVCEVYDYAILAAPPSAWPAVDGPGWHPSAYAMQHGPAVKHLNRFARKFWEDHHLSPSAVWNELGSVWEGTDQQSGPGEFDLSVYAGGPYVQPEAHYRHGLTELYPGYAPSHTRFVDWPHRPYVLTGYSVPAPGQVTTIGPNLAQPLGGRLFFAGEQAYLGFFGYMEGALQSGGRAARDVVGAISPAAIGLHTA